MGAWKAVYEGRPYFAGKHVYVVVNKRAEEASKRNESVILILLHIVVKFFKKRQHTKVLVRLIEEGVL